MSVQPPGDGAEERPGEDAAQAAGSAIAAELERVELLQSAGIRPIGWDLDDAGPTFHFDSPLGPQRIVVTREGWERLPAAAVALQVAQEVVVQAEWRRRNRG